MFTSVLVRVGLSLPIPGSNAGSRAAAASFIAAKILPRARRLVPAPAPVQRPSDHARQQEESKWVQGNIPIWTSNWSG